VTHPEIDLLLPEFNYWCKSLSYIIDNNASHSVRKDGPPFNPDHIDVAPFSNLEIAAQLPITFQMLAPPSQHYSNVIDTITAASTAVWTRIRRLNYPVPAILPPPAPPTPAATFGPVEVTALVQGITSATAKSPSLTEAEQVSYAKSIATHYALIFAKVQSSADPHAIPTVIPATLDPSFNNIPNTTKNAHAQRELA
jgi:hypothetical protein